jgi:hypothetical protein
MDGAVAWGWRPDWDRGGFDGAQPPSAMATEAQNHKRYLEELERIRDTAVPAKGEVLFR